MSQSGNFPAFSLQSISQWINFQHDLVDLDKRIRIQISQSVRAIL